MEKRKIKTEKDFWEFSDVWYQRTLKLAQIAFHSEEPEEKREKALRLWFEMYQRMNVLFGVAKQISLKPPINLEFGTHSQINWK